MTPMRGGALVRWVLAAVLMLLAAQRLSDGFYDLVWGPVPPIDLHYRWNEVQRWFAGQPVYTQHKAEYPPASNAVLWLPLGWLDFTGARWLWGATSAPALAWLALLATRESGVTSRVSVVAAALLPLAAYPARAVIVNGQLALHLLPLALAGLLLLQRRSPSWARDLAGTALLLGALAKPTLSAPFIWLAATVRAPARPLAMIGCGYVGLTLLALRFQPESAVTLLGQYLIAAPRAALRVAPDGHGNVHSWLAALDLAWAFAPVSLAVLGAFGGWVYLARHADIWVRLGAAAIVARIWTSHFRYDDALVLVALVPLCRMLPPGGHGIRDWWAVVLLTLTGASLLMPARVLFPPFPWAAMEAAQTVVWLATLGLLLGRGLRAGVTGERAGPL